MKKKTVLFFIAVFFIFNGFILLSQELKTGESKKFVPGDKLLFQEDFSKCPVGEIPISFDKIKGAGECVRYGDNIYFTSINGDLKLFKRLFLGNDEFSVEFDVLFLKGECGELEVSFYEGEKVGDRHIPYNVSVGPGCTGEAVYVGLENMGKIFKSDYKSLKRKIHMAIQVRRKQMRVFLNGKRLSMILFKGNVKSVGFHIRGKYSELITNIRIAKYSNKEEKPSPEKLGIKVEKTGGEIKLTIPEKLLFDFNKFFLKPEAKKALEVIADILKKDKNKKILITGYTDNIGSKTYNLRLSLQRAQSVADYLVYVEGINSERIKIVGKGESNPIADNSTEKGRAINRRVEIKIY